MIGVDQTNQVRRGQQSLGHRIANRQLNSTTAGPFAVGSGGVEQAREVARQHRIARNVGMKTSFTAAAPAPIGVSIDTGA
jgi:hypothetical protein